MNRVDRLVYRLENAGSEGVCLAEVDQADAYTMRNACVTARQTGYRIRSERCRKHRHSSTVSRYFLEGKVAPSSVAVESCGGSPANGVGATPLAPAPTALDLFPEVTPLRQGHGL
jgi:hypothetical protein